MLTNQGPSSPHFWLAELIPHSPSDNLFKKLSGEKTFHIITKLLQGMEYI